MSFLDEGCLCLKGKSSHVWSGRMSVVNLDNDQFLLTPEFVSSHLPLKIARPTGSTTNKLNRTLLRTGKRGTGTNDRSGIVKPRAQSTYRVEDLRHTLFRAATGESLSRGILLPGTRRFGKRLDQSSNRVTSYTASECR